MNPSDHPAIVWCGRFFTNDGYGNAARLHVDALRSEGVPVLSIDSESREVVGSVPEAMFRIDTTAESISVRTVDPDRRVNVVVHDRPDQYQRVAATGRARMIGYSYWETTSLPADWPALMSSMDRVWTSSDFNRDSFVRSGVPEWMIDTIGHPADQLLAEAADAAEDYRQRWSEATVFLSVVSSTVGRRDLAMLFEAYATAFGADDDVALVLKVPPNGAAKVERIIEQVMTTLPARRSGHWPTVYTIPSTLSREQLVRLHASVDCYVSCERGDGWDLPAMDSLLLGVPVVATDFGASSTFIEDGDSYLVKTSTKMVRCDDVLETRHNLYSGQFWPYVDPAELGRQLVLVHEDPAERVRRGAHAQARLRKTYSRPKVVAELLELVCHGTEVDFRSNDPAVLTVSSSDNIWQVPRPNTEMARNPSVNEIRLLEMLELVVAPRIGNPSAWISSYKAATNFARSTPSLERTPTRRALSQVMATPFGQLPKKARALRNLKASVDRRVEHFGGQDEVRRLVDAANDYQQSLNGGRSKFTGAESEARRRPLWGHFGPFVSPQDDLARLAQLRNRHAGERVFILGNGPSLVKCDLTMLEHEYTFGVNKIYMLFDKINWRPDFYTLLDWKMGEGIQDELHQLDGIVKFFPERFRGILEPDADTYWYWPRSVGQHVEHQFEPDMVRGIPSRATVLVSAIQQAFHLGFREIYLIGADASYKIPDTVIQSGPDRFGTGVKLNLESTEDDDPNHFAPTYFGKGSHWHDPNVAEMRRLFRTMRKGVERHGGKLINATVGGELEELPRADFDSLFTGR